MDSSDENGDEDLGAVTTRSRGNRRSGKRKRTEVEAKEREKGKMKKKRKLEGEN